ncbi:MAG TPA: hypothetical protein PKE06_07060 [Flavilitoribacter sp.]|nr:hypothetical protein [Flavilitoribacter sp.]HMQ88583.1 hypothetical protein [Flavilitoribacter sp.]
MNRIMVIGCSGAGKSSLSRELSRILGIELHHLDRYYWRAGWQEAPHAEWKQSHLDLISQPKWIIDGNYGSTMEMRLTHADTVVFLDYSRWICLYRAVKRMIVGFGKTRPDMAQGCPEHFDREFLSYIFHFPEKHRPRTVDKLSRVDPGEVKVYQFRTPRQTRRFLARLKKDKG